MKHSTMLEQPNKAAPRLWWAAGERPLPLRAALKLGAAALWLAVWFIAYSLLHKPLLLPHPLDVVGRIGTLLLTGEFWLSVGASFGRVLLGFLLGAAAGCLLAAVLYRFYPVYALVHPLLVGVKATPVASFIILALVWVRAENLAVFISFLMVLPLVCENVYQALRGTDRALLEMAAVYRLSGWERARRIYIPSALPQFVAAVRVGIGFAWKAGISAEVLGTPPGAIGTRLYEAKIYLETVDLFAWTAIVILLSMGIEALLVRALRGVPQKGGRSVG